MSTAVKDARRRSLQLTPSGSRLIIMIVCAAAAGALLALPRPVVPRELPGLRTTRAELAEARAEDARRASSAPRDEATETLRAALGALRAADAAGDPTAQSVARAGRDRALAAFAARPEALGAFVAEEMVRFDARWSEIGSSRAALAEADPESFGGLGRSLTDYSAFVDDSVVAPPLTVRAVYETVLNRELLREPTRDLLDVERRALFGWVALHAGGTHVERRLGALEGYVEAGGQDGSEARAYFAFFGGELAQAAVLYQAAYEATGATRARNHALAAGAGFE